MYRIYNKILRTSRKANDLVLMFSSFKIITVDSDIKLTGSYEDNLFVVTKN